MSKLTRDEIVQSLGWVEDKLIADILATGASREEFLAARHWHEDNEAPMNAGEHLATGRVARVLTLLEEADTFEDAY